MRVVARFKPLSEEENAHHKDKKISPMCVIYDQQNIEVVDRRHHAGAPPSPYFNKVAKQHGPINEMAKNFTIDEVFSDTTTQAEIHERVGRPIVKNVLKGYNGTVLAYGQTGSGKTHSMMGPAGGGLDVFSKDSPHYKMRGIVPRMVEELFQRLNAIPRAERTWTVAVSIFEIYREEIFDLLAPSSTGNPPNTFGSDGNGGRERYRIREDLLSGQGIYIESLEKPEVQTAEEVIALIRYAANKRKTAVTNINETSSRSHSLVVIYLDQVDYTSVREGQRIVSRLNLVDLAGSEKLHKTNAVGERLEEAKKINLSLTLLGNVIYKLTDGKSGYVPYRDSKLTRILQESLGGNSITTLVCHCSIAMYNREETLSTLRFAQRAKRVRNKPQINKDLSAKELKLQLVAAEHKIISLENKLQVKSDIIARLRDSREAQDDELQSLIESLMHELEQLREEVALKEEELGHEKGRANLYRREAERMTSVCEKEREQHAKELQALQRTLEDTQEENKSLRRQLADLHKEWELAVAMMTPRKPAKASLPLPSTPKVDQGINTEVPYPEKDTTHNEDSLIPPLPPTSSSAISSSSSGGVVPAQQSVLASTITEENQVHRKSFMLGRPHTADLTNEIMKARIAAAASEGAVKGSHLTHMEEEEEDPGKRRRKRMETGHPLDASRPSSPLALLHGTQGWEGTGSFPTSGSAVERNRESPSCEEGQEYPLRNEKKLHKIQEEEAIKERMRKEWMLLTEQPITETDGDHPMVSLAEDYIKRGRRCPACGHMVLFAVETRTQGTCTPPLITLFPLDSSSSSPLLLTSTPAGDCEDKAVSPSRADGEGERESRELPEWSSLMTMQRPLNNEEIRRILHTTSAFIQACLLRTAPSSAPFLLEGGEKRQSEDHEGDNAWKEEEDRRRREEMETSLGDHVSRKPPTSSTVIPPPEVLRAVAFLVALLRVIGQAVREDDLSHSISVVMEQTGEEEQRKNLIHHDTTEDSMPGVGEGIERTAAGRAEAREVQEERGVHGQRVSPTRSLPHPDPTALHTAQEALQEALHMAARVLNAWRQNGGTLFPEDLVSSSFVPPKRAFLHPSPSSSLPHASSEARATASRIPLIFYAQEHLLSFLVLKDMRQRLLRRSGVQVQVTAKKQYVLVQDVLRATGKVPLSYSMWCRHALTRKLRAMVSTHFPPPPPSTDATGTGILTTHYSSPLWNFLHSALEDLGKTLETELYQEGGECWGPSVSKYLSEKVYRESQAQARALHAGIVEMTARMEKLCEELFQYPAQVEQEKDERKCVAVGDTRRSRRVPDALLASLRTALQHVAEEEVGRMYHTAMSSIQSSASKQSPLVPPLAAASDDALEKENHRNMEVLFANLKKQTTSISEHLSAVGEVHINAIISQFPSFLRHCMDESSPTTGDGAVVKKEEGVEEQALVMQLREVLLQVVKEEASAMCSQREAEIVQELQVVAAEDPGWRNKEFLQQKEEMKEAVSREIQELVAKMSVLAKYMIPPMSPLPQSQGKKALKSLSPPVREGGGSSSLEQMASTEKDGQQTVAFTHGAGRSSSEANTQPGIPAGCPANTSMVPFHGSGSALLTPFQLEALVHQLRVVGLPHEEGAQRLRKLLLQDGTFSLSHVVEPPCWGANEMPEKGTKIGFTSITHDTSLPSGVSCTESALPPAAAPFSLLPPHCWAAALPYLQQTMQHLRDTVMQTSKHKIKMAREKNTIEENAALHPLLLPLVPSFAMMEWISLPVVEEPFGLDKWKAMNEREGKEENHQQATWAIAQLWEREMGNLYSHIHSRLLEIMQGVKEALQSGAKEEGTSGALATARILPLDQIALSQRALCQEEIDFLTSKLTAAALGVWWEELQRDANVMPLSAALDRYKDKLTSLSNTELEEMRRGHQEMVEAARLTLVESLQEEALSSSAMQELRKELEDTVKEWIAFIKKKCHTVLLEVTPQAEEEGTKAAIDQWCERMEERLLCSLGAVAHQECKTIAETLIDDELSTSLSLTSPSSAVHPLPVKDENRRKTDRDEMMLDAFLPNVMEEELSSLRNNLEEKILQAALRREGDGPSSGDLVRERVEEASLSPPYLWPQNEKVSLLGNQLDLLHIAHEEIQKKRGKEQEQQEGEDPPSTNSNDSSTLEIPSSSVALSPFLSVVEQVVKADVQRFFDEASKFLSEQERVIYAHQAMWCERLLHLFSLSPVAFSTPSPTRSEAAVIEEEGFQGVGGQDIVNDKEEATKGIHVDGTKTALREQQAKWLMFVEQVLKRNRSDDRALSSVAGEASSFFTPSEQKAIYEVLPHLFRRVIPTLPFLRSETALWSMRAGEARGGDGTSSAVMRFAESGGRFFPFGFTAVACDRKGEEAQDAMLEHMRCITTKLLLPDRHSCITQAQLDHLKTVLLQQLLAFMRELHPSQASFMPLCGKEGKEESEEEAQNRTSRVQDSTMASAVPVEESYVPITTERIEALISQLQMLCVSDMSQMCADHAVEDEKALKEIEYFIMSAVSRCIPMAMQRASPAEDTSGVESGAGTAGVASSPFNIEVMASKEAVSPLSREEGTGEVEVVNEMEGMKERTPRAQATTQAAQWFPLSVLPHLLREVDRICETLFTTSSRPTPPPDSSFSLEGSSSSIRSNSLRLRGELQEKEEDKKMGHKEALLHVTPEQLSLLRGKLVELAINEQYHQWEQQQSALAERIENAVVARLRQEQMRDNLDRMECFQHYVLSMMDGVVARLVRATTEAQMWEGTTAPVEVMEGAISGVHEGSVVQATSQREEGPGQELSQDVSLFTGGMVVGRRGARDLPHAAATRETLVLLHTEGLPPAASCIRVRPTPRALLLPSHLPSVGEVEGPSALERSPIPKAFYAKEAFLRRLESMPSDWTKKEMANVASRLSLYRTETETSVRQSSVHVAQVYVQELMAVEVEQSWKEGVLSAQPYVVLMEEMAGLSPVDLTSLAQQIRHKSVERVQSLREVSAEVPLPLSSATPCSSPPSELDERRTREKARATSEELDGNSLPRHGLLPDVYTDLCQQLENRAASLMLEDPFMEWDFQPVSQEPSLQNSKNGEENQRVPIIWKKAPPQVIEQLSHEILDLRPAELTLLTHRLATHTQQDIPPVTNEEQVKRAVELLVAYLNQISTATDGMEEGPAHEDSSSLSSTALCTTAVVRPSINPATIEHVLELVEEAMGKERHAIRQKRGSHDGASLSSLVEETPRVNLLVHRGTSPAFPSAISPPESNMCAPDVLHQALRSLQDWCARLQALSSVLENAAVQEVQREASQRGSASPVGVPSVLICAPSSASLSISPIRGVHHSNDQDLFLTPHSVHNFQLFLQNTPKEGSAKASPEVHAVPTPNDLHQSVELLRDYCAAALRERSRRAKQVNPVGEGTTTASRTPLEKEKEKGAVTVYIGLKFPAVSRGNPLMCLSPYLTHYHHQSAEVVAIEDDEAKKQKETLVDPDLEDKKEEQKASDVEYVSMISMLNACKTPLKATKEVMTASHTIGNTSFSPSPRDQKHLTEAVLSEAQILADLNALQAVELVLRRHIALAAPHGDSGPRMSEGQLFAGAVASPAPLSSIQQDLQSMLGIEAAEKEILLASRTVQCVWDRSAYRQPLEQHRLEMLLQEYGIDMAEYFPAVEPRKGKDYMIRKEEKRRQYDVRDPIESGGIEKTASAEKVEEHAVEDSDSKNHVFHQGKEEEHALLRTLQSFFYLHQHLQKHPFRGKRATASVSPLHGFSSTSSSSASSSIRTSSTLVAPLPTSSVWDDVVLPLYFDTLVKYFVAEDANVQEALCALNKEDVYGNTMANPDMATRTRKGEEKWPSGAQDSSLVLTYPEDLHKIHQQPAPLHDHTGKPASLLDRLQAMQCIADAVGQVLNLQRSFFLSSFLKDAMGLARGTPSMGTRHGIMSLPPSSPSSLPPSYRRGEGGGVKRSSPSHSTLLSKQDCHPAAGGAALASRSPSPYHSLFSTHAGGAEGRASSSTSLVPPLLGHRTAEREEKDVSHPLSSDPSWDHESTLPFLLEEREKELEKERMEEENERRRKSGDGVFLVPQEPLSPPRVQEVVDTAGRQRSPARGGEEEDGVGKALWRRTRKTRRWSGRDVCRVFWVGQNLAATVQARMSSPPSAVAHVSSTSLPREVYVEKASSRVLSPSLDHTGVHSSDSSPVPLALQWVSMPSSSAVIASSTVEYTLPEQIQLLSVALRCLSEENIEEEGGPTDSMRQDDKKEDSLQAQRHAHSSSPISSSSPQELCNAVCSTSHNVMRNASLQHPLFGMPSERTREEEMREGGPHMIPAYQHIHEDPVWQLLRREDVRIALLAFLEKEKRNEHDVDGEEGESGKRRRGRRGKRKPNENGVRNVESAFSSLTFSSSVLPSSPPLSPRSKEGLHPVMETLQVPVVGKEEEWRKAMRVLEEGLRRLEDRQRSETPEEGVAVPQVTVEDVPVARKEGEEEDAYPNAEASNRENRRESGGVSGRVPDTHTRDVSLQTSISLEKAMRTREYGVMTHDAAVASVDDDRSKVPEVQEIAETRNAAPTKVVAEVMEVEVQTALSHEGEDRIAEEMSCLMSTSEKVQELLESCVGVSREEMEEMKRCVAANLRDAESIPKSSEPHTRVERASQGHQSEVECNALERMKGSTEVLHVFLDRLGREIGFMKKVREPFWRLAVEDREKLLAGIFDAMRELSHALDTSSLEVTQKQDFFEQRIRCLSNGGFRPNAVLGSVDEFRQEVQKADQKMKMLEGEKQLAPSSDAVVVSSSQDSTKLEFNGDGSVPPPQSGIPLRSKTGTAKRVGSNPGVRSTPLRLSSRPPGSETSHTDPLHRRPSPIVLQALTTLKELAKRHSISNAEPPTSALPSSSRYATAPNEKQFREDPRTGEVMVVDHPMASPRSAPSRDSGEVVVPSTTTKLQKKASKAPKEVVTTLQRTAEWINDVQSLHFDLLQRYADAFRRAEKLEELLEKSKYQWDDSKQELDALKLILDAKEKENQNMRSVLEEMNIDLDVYLSDLEHQKLVNARLAKKASQLQNQAALLATTAEQQEFSEMAGLELAIRTEEMCEIESALDNVHTFYDPELIAKKRQHLGKTIRSIGAFCQKMLSMCQARPRFNTGTLESQRLNILQGTAELYNRFEWAKEELNDQFERQKAGVAR